MSNNIYDLYKPSVEPVEEEAPTTVSDFREIPKAQGSIYNLYKAGVEPPKTTLPESYARSFEGMSTFDFRKNPEIVRRYENILEYLSQSNFTMLDAGTDPEEDDDVVEFLRDDMMKIESAVAKAMALKDAPASVKADYRYLRSAFDKTEVKGIAEQARRIRDIGTDMIFNYGNASTLALAAITGAGSFGTGTAAVGAGRIASGKAATKALDAVLRVANPTNIKTFAGQGALLGSSAMLGEQELELSIDERQNYDPAELVVAGVVGAGMGAAVGGAGLGVNKLLNRRRIEDANTDLLIEDPEVKVNNVPFTNTQNKTSQEVADELGISVEEVESLDQDFINDLLERVNDQVNEISPNQVDLIAALSDDVSRLGVDASEEAVASLPSVSRLTEALGGGQQTFDRIVDDALAATRQETPGRVKSHLLFNLNKTASIFTSSIGFGKAAGFLSPFRNISPTARLLQDKSSTEFAMDWRPSGGQKVIQEDYAEAMRNIKGSFFNLYNSAVLPISTTKFNTKLQKDVNAALSLAVRGRSSKDEAYSSQVNVAALQIQRAYKTVGRLLKREGFISEEVENYVPRQWKRSAIENNQKEFEKLLVQSGEASSLAEAKIIRKNMLKIENQVPGESTDGYFFSSKRAFNKIKDDAMFEKFLNNDVKETYFNYITQASRALAKKRVFGVRNLEEFQEKWREQIVEEIEDATGKSLSSREKARIDNLYVTLTGEGASKPGSFNQGLQLATRMALLPLATASSLTEILLNLGVAGGSSTLKGVSQAASISKAKFTGDWNEFADAHKLGFLKITEDTHKKLQDDFGLTAEEAWHEMQSVGLAMEQSLVSMADRLAGEELTNGAMAWVSNKFFRANLLDQWTKFVQNTSYHAGKNMIRRDLQDIAAHGNAPITRRIQAKMDNLAEFGVDINEGVAWIKSGADKNADYYGSIVKGAGRYANQIILQPDRASGLRSRAHYTPLGAIATQLMGYPTAFTNNILKRGAKRLTRDKEIAAAQLVPTALLMTAAAGATNYIRTRGEGFEDKEPFEIGYEALARWGGNGLYMDSILRAKESAIISGNPIMGAPAGFLGPIYSDFIQLSYGLNPISVLGRKVPFYGAGKTVLGDEAMEDYRGSLREADKAVREFFLGEKLRTPYKKGGEVDVPQAPEEPDERIDKMTGRPYNIQAGEAFIDEEDMPKSLLAREA